jgi:hypothetical protein
VRVIFTEVECWQLANDLKRAIYRFTDRSIVKNHLLDGVDRRYLTADECDGMVVLAQRACGAVAALRRYLRGSQR